MLVDYYKWAELRFGKKTKRTHQRKVHEFGLSVIEAAHDSTLIDPERADEQLARHARPAGDRSPRKRGRPRKVAVRDFDEEPAAALAASAVSVKT